MNHYKITVTESYESIKLGIDAHAKWYYVARQLDGATPQPVQKMDFEGLLHFVTRQKRMAREVHTCYEAEASFVSVSQSSTSGPCGTSWIFKARSTGSIRAQVVRPASASRSRTT